MTLSPFWFTFLCLLFVFAMSTLGAALIFPLKENRNSLYTKLALGFAAGIMLSAAVFSLLIPAMDGEGRTFLGMLKIILAFCLGVALLIGMDKCLPHLHLFADSPEGPKAGLSREVLMFFAVTIHNIPEGMAVGISAAAATMSDDPAMMSAALALAFGIGIQNIPEGTAVALPYHASGMSKKKAFSLGMLAGAVEPLAGIVVFFCAGYLAVYMPLLLAFAAGAMFYVIVEELIPEAHLTGHSDLGTLSVLSGFLLMLLFDTLF